jgi:hypothetical protein
MLRHGRTVATLLDREANLKATIRACSIRNNRRDYLLDVVLRLQLTLVGTERGGRRRPLADGYRASLSFGRRKRGVEPIVHDAILVLEDASEVAPGGSAIARVWVLVPDEFPRSVQTGTRLTLLEGDRIVAAATVLGIYDDPTPFPLSDIAAAKTRALEPGSLA